MRTRGSLKKNTTINIENGTVNHFESIFPLRLMKKNCLIVNLKSSSYNTNKNYLK